MVFWSLASDSQMCFSIFLIFRIPGGTLLCKYSIFTAYLRPLGVVMLAVFLCLCLATYTGMFLCSCKVSSCVLHAFSHISGWMVAPSSVCCILGHECCERLCSILPSLFQLALLQGLRAYISSGHLSQKSLTTLVISLHVCFCSGNKNLLQEYLLGGRGYLLEYLLSTLWCSLFTCELLPQFQSLCTLALPLFHRSVAQICFLPCLGSNF